MKKTGDQFCGTVAAVCVPAAMQWCEPKRLHGGSTVRLRSQNSSPVLRLLIAL